jgi:hypothetical protein
MPLKASMSSPKSVNKSFTESGDSLGEVISLTASILSTADLR